jgi:hypothetical protein
VKNEQKIRFDPFLFPLSFLAGYQWTRKVGGRTITVALSAEQFQALGQAVENERRLWKTLQKMERLSRRILFQNLPHTRRRKRLGSKVLGLI